MFKIDWPTAIGGAVIGYLAKGKVEDIKRKCKGICTSALENYKESFEDSQNNGGHDGH